MGWGPYIVAALEQVKTYHKRGLAIIEAFPGVIYGPGSWYMELIRFLVKGNPIITMPGRVRYSSYMHVDDCARGLLHLFEHGSPGKRYFLVDDAPSNFVELGMLSSQALGIETRRQSVPYWLIRLLFGAVLADSSRYENRLSNATLRATGFQLQFPTLQVGVPNAIEQIKQTSPEITRLAAKRKR
jgi:nucleoside-diphosphate-sugar epimerase